jgi:hypothetical protein
MANLRIHVDQNLAIRHPRENVEGWHEAKIRAGVYRPGSVELDDQFLLWRSRCAGRIIIQKEAQSSEHIIPNTRIYFEHREDLVSYLLTFDEIVRPETIDVAVFYCPYVPLTVSGVVIKSGGTKQNDLDNGDDP